MEAKSFEYKLLKEMVSIPSPSGSEGAVGKYLFDLLSKEGFLVEKNMVGKDRFNIIAKVGEPKIYLAAHMDTVSPFIEYSEDEEFIYGRGSCDTKASIAAMITAALEAKNKDIDNFGLIFTVGEESTLDGARSIVEMGLNIPYIVVGEPTSLEIVNGHFGILILKVSAKGRAAHSSRPEKGVNAIDILLSAIDKIKKGSIYPETLMSLVQIRGGVADNIIPDEARATYSFRISPKDTNDYLSKFKSVTEGVTVEVEQEIGAIYSKVPNELDFINEVKTVKYLTELSFYKKGVVIGPGDIQYAHGPDEKLPRKELAEAVKVYEKILANFS